MNDKQRRVLRAAQLVREQMIESRCCHSHSELPEQQWTNLLQLSRKIERARDRGWINAARRLTDDLRREMHILQSRLIAVSNGLDSQTATNVPNEREIFREIMVLEDEFAPVKVDPRAGEICVTTEPVILEGIYFGPFEIHLDLRCIGDQSPYRVVAVEPNRSSTNESVTHPHVSDETLCEGDGRTAIRAALAAGRLYDFFVLVRQTLTTYARGEAYVELSDWDGVPCKDCGSLTNEDNLVSCRSCGDSICLDCAVTCQVCGDDRCAGCISTCAVCDSYVCDSCLARCAKCQSLACSDCLVDGVCTQCLEEEEEDHETETTAETVGAELAVQSAGLGQAAVPA